MAQLLGDIVALIDNKILVEDLEDLPPLKICHAASRLTARSTTGSESKRSLDSLWAMEYKAEGPMDDEDGTRSTRELGGVEAPLSGEGTDAELAFSP